MKKKYLLLSIFFFQLAYFPLLRRGAGGEVFSQVSLSNTNFPLAGSEYNRFICVDGSVGPPGTSQQYNFSNAMVWANDTIRYIDPVVTGFSSSHPGSSVATVQWSDISVIWYYSSDSNAYWTSGGTLIGDFGQGMTVIHANHPSLYVDTLISNEYTYGHIETEISGIRFQNLSPGVDYQTISGKYIVADGWGTLFAPLDTFSNVLRVKYIEFKYDTVFANNVPVDANTDTLYYYKYFEQGTRHPVVIAYTDTFDNVQWMEIIHFPDTLFGCTDTAAENFNPLANSDNGSCIYCNQVNYTISPDTNICPGDSIVLSASGASNYMWSTGDSVSSIVISPDSSKTISVYLSNQSYCWEVGSVDITVSENVQAGFWADLTNPSDGDTILFINTSTNAINYFWDFGDSITSTEKNPRHLFTSEGTKTVVLVASNQCSSDTFYFTITIIGENELELADYWLRVYPNPGDGKFTIQISGIQNPATKIKVFNILGEVVYRSQISPDKHRGKSQIPFDISEEPPGIYFIQLNSGENIFNQRIIKQ